MYFSNVFLMDSVTGHIVDDWEVDNPKEFAHDKAISYSLDFNFKPKHIHIPNKKYKNRYGIPINSDYFIHYYTLD